MRVDRIASAHLVDFAAAAGIASNQRLPLGELNLFDVAVVAVHVGVVAAAAAADTAAGTVPVAGTAPVAVGAAAAAAAGIASNQE